MFWDILQYIGLFSSFLYLWLEFHQRPVMWIVSATCSAIYASIYCHAQIYGDMSFSLFNICMCAYGFWKWMQKRGRGDGRDSESKASWLALPSHDGRRAKLNESTSQQAEEDQFFQNNQSSQCIQNIQSIQSIQNSQSTPSSPKKEILYRHFRWGEFGVVTLATAAIWFAIFLILKYLTDSPVPALDAFTTTLNIVGTWVLAQKIIEVWGYWFLVNLLSIYLYVKRGLHLTTILLYAFYLCASIYGYWKWRRYGKLMT